MFRTFETRQVGTDGELLTIRMDSTRASASDGTRTSRHSRIPITLAFNKQKGSLMDYTIADLEDH